MGFSTPQNNSNIIISGLHIDIVAAKKKTIYGIKLFVRFAECFCRELGVRHLRSLNKNAPTDFTGVSYRFG